MTHLNHELPLDPALDALFNRTLGSGGLSANQMRRHRERLGLAANSTAVTMPRENPFSTPVERVSTPPVVQPSAHGVLRERLELVTVLVVIAMVLTGVVLYQTVFSGAGGDDWSIGGTELSDDYAVYVASGGNTGPGSLLPIDKDSLEDRSDVSEIETSFQTSLIASRDRSTLVRLEFTRSPSLPDEARPAEDVTIVVLDGLTGAERARFHPPEYASRPLLSNDGSRLAVQSTLVQGETEPPSWYVFDTADGRLVSTIQRDSRAGWDEMFFSADAGTLYRAWVTPSSLSDSPEPLRIIAYDIETGDEIERIELSDIPAGAWNRYPDTRSLMTDLVAPGVALSPDGQHFAIAHADTQTVTVVDAERLTVQRTIQLTDTEEPLPWFEPVTRDPGIQVRDNIEMWAQFSADGRNLYVYGNAVIADERGNPQSYGNGLTLVDLEQGTVLERAYEGERVGSVTVAPDGRNIYVTTYTGSVDVPQLIQRLDARTLDVLAERRFDAFNTIVIDPPERDLVEDDADGSAPTPRAGDADPVYMVLAQQLPHMRPERGQMLQPMHPTTLEPLPGKEPFDFGHHYTYAFSPDSQTLASINWPSSTSSRGGRLYLLDLDSWTNTATNVTFDDRVGNLVFSPDGTYLYWNELTPRMPGYEEPSDYVLYRYEVVSSEHFRDPVVRLPTTFEPAGMQMFDDGRRMAIFGSPALVSAGDTPGPPQVLIVDLESPTSSTDAIDAVVDLDGVRNWQHPPDDAEETRLNTYLPGLAWDTERNRLYIVHTDEDAVTVVDLAQGSVIAQQQFGQQAPEGQVHRYAAINDDGTRLYAMGNGFQVIDTGTLTELDRLDASVAEFTLLPGGDRILLHVVENSEIPNQSANPEHSLVLYDGERLAESGHLEIESVFPMHGISGDGSYAYLSKKEIVGDVPGLEVRAVALETMEIVATYNYDDAWYANFLRQ